MSFSCVGLRAGYCGSFARWVASLVVVGLVLFEAYAEILCSISQYDIMSSMNLFPMLIA